MADMTILFQEDSFEDLAIKNGVNLWNEADLMKALGYQTEESFKKVIQKAQHACLSLGIAIEDNFVRQTDASYRLTRFACYLIAINGDPKKPEVATAQVYFAKLADTFQSAVEHAQAVDRVLIREEVNEAERSLTIAAKQHGIEHLGFLYGFRGMYNMDIDSLIKKRGLSQEESLVDRMGNTEIAAHLFRITQTEAMIKRDSLKGESLLQRVAEKVGKKIRQTMIEISGQKPENLPIAPPIKDVKKKLKSTSKQFQKLDHHKPEITETEDSQSLDDSAQK